MNVTTKLSLQVTKEPYGDVITRRKPAEDQAGSRESPLRGMKMILLITEDRAGFRAAKPGLKDRLQTWVRSARLDTDLARGVPPESTAALAIHAERLTRPTACRQLARSIRRIAAEARPESWTNPIVPL